MYNNIYCIAEKRQCGTFENYDEDEVFTILDEQRFLIDFIVKPEDSNVIPDIEELSDIGIKTKPLNSPGSLPYEIVSVEETTLTEEPLVSNDYGPLFLLNGNVYRLEEFKEIIKENSTKKYTVCKIFLYHF